VTNCAKTRENARPTGHGNAAETRDGLIKRTARKYAALMKQPSAGRGRTAMRFASAASPHDEQLRSRASSGATTAHILLTFRTGPALQFPSATINKARR